MKMVRSVMAIASVALVSSSEVLLASSEVASHNSTVSSCGAAAFAYCCHTGTPCNCNAGIVTPGQCGRDAYNYCCGTGTPCMCAVGDNLADTKEVAQVVVSNEPLLELPFSEVSTHNTEWNLYSASAISDMEQLVVGSNAQDVDDLLPVEVVDMPLTSSDAMMAKYQSVVSGASFSLGALILVYLWLWLTLQPWGGVRISTQNSVALFVVVYNARQL